MVLWYTSTSFCQEMPLAFSKLRQTEEDVNIEPYLRLVLFSLKQDEGVWYVTVTQIVQSCLYGAGETVMNSSWIMQQDRVFLTPEVRGGTNYNLLTADGPHWSWHFIAVSVRRVLEETDNAIYLETIIQYG